MNCFSRCIIRKLKINLVSKTNIKIIIAIVFIILGARASSANDTTYYVSNSGNDWDSGTSVLTPWKTIKSSIAKLKAGDTLLIREGMYRESEIKITNQGTATNPITIKNYPGENPVIDNSWPEFSQVPNSEWEIVDLSKQIYRSKRTYAITGNYPGVVGFMVANSGQQYSLLSTSLENLSAENSDYSLNPFYVGPCICWNKEDQKIYIRLSPPNPDSIGGKSYNPITDLDPEYNKLYIAPNYVGLQFSGSPCYITFEGFTMSTFGHMARLVGDNITFRNMSFHAPKYGITVDSPTSHDLIFEKIIFNHYLPPWISWVDVKNGIKPAYYFQIYSITTSASSESYNILVKDSTFNDSFDFLSFFNYSHDVKVENNRFNGNRDDAINIGCPAYNVEIVNNEFINGLAGVSRYSGSSYEPPPDQIGKVYIHNNIFENSERLLTARKGLPASESSWAVWLDGSPWVFGEAFGSHGSLTISPWKIYNNTFVVARAKGGFGSNAVYNSPNPAFPNEVYNNIFYMIQHGEVLRGADVIGGGAIFDGNLYYRPNETIGDTYVFKNLPLFYIYTNSGVTASFKSLDAFKQSDYYYATRTNYPLGWEISGIEADPQLDNNYVPSATGPAATGAIDLSAKGWPGADGAPYRGAINPTIVSNPSTISERVTKNKKNLRSFLRAGLF
jgi:hypothetical protein